MKIKLQIKGTEKSMYRLVDNNGQEIKNGETVKCFRGNEHTVVGYAPPKHSASSGRVITKSKQGHQYEYFPSVFNLRIEEIEN